MASNTESSGNYNDYIFGFLIRQECNYVVDAGILFRNDPKRDESRTKLMDMLVLIAHKLHASQETLYHSVGLIDRTLAKNGDYYNCIQVVGAASLLIASKFVENSSLDVELMLKLFPECIKKNNVLDMERQLLTLHNFDVRGVDPMVFIRHLIGAAEYQNDGEFKETALLLYDTLLSYKSYSAFPSSLVAASAVCGALSLFEKHWNETLSTVSKYDTGQVAGLAKIMLVNLYHMKSDENIPILIGARLKYSCRTQHMNIFNSSRFEISKILKAIDLMSKSINLCKSKSNNIS